MTVRDSRRRFIQAAGAVTLGFPAIVRAQKPRELVIGGAASHKAFLDPGIIPKFEKKYGCKIRFEGTRSLTNLEKMVSNRSRPYLGVVMMDDPVMIQAVREGVLEKLSEKTVPNIAKLKKGAVHYDGMWVNYQQPYTGIAYNTQRIKTPPTSWADLWNPQHKGRIVVPSLQNTEGLSVYYYAAAMEAKKPVRDAQTDVDAAFKRLAGLKRNLLTVYTQMPQAFNLLEQGEAVMIGGALSSFALGRKRQGAPIDLAAPKEGVMAMPSGIARVLNGPDPELAYAFINDMLGEHQAEAAELAFAIPTNTTAPLPKGLPKVEVFVPDWAIVAASRGEWVKRWDKEMAV